MNAPAGLRRILNVLGNRNFAIWMAANGVSLIGMWAQRIGVGWLAWELTHSAFWVGIMAAAELIPGMIITPLAGIIGDRYNRMTVVRITQGVSAAVSAALAAMVLTGTTTFFLLLMLSVLQGIAMAFKQPARMALTKYLVEEKDLGTAIGLNAVLFNLARFIGPMIAGILILADGIESVFVFALAGSLILVVALQFVQLRPARIVRSEAAGGPATPESPTSEDHIPPMRGAGYAYAFSHPGIGPLLLLMFSGGFLLRGFAELFPGYSAAALDSGAEGLAALSASIGVGAMVAGFWLAQRDGVAGLTRQVFISQALASVLIAILAGTGSLFVASALVGLVGFMLTVTGIAAQTLIQTRVPEDRLARVLATFGLIMRASPAVGAIIMGAAADLVGFAIPLIVGGGLSLAVVAMLWRREATVRLAMEHGEPQSA